MKNRTFFKNLNNRQLLSLLTFFLVVLLFFVFIVYREIKYTLLSQKPSGVNNELLQLPDVSGGAVLDHPEFMSDQEKEKFNVSKDLKMQIIKRGADGKTEIYKIIKDDSDIVSNPREIKAMQPSDPN